MWQAISSLLGEQLGSGEIDQRTELPGGEIDLLLTDAAIVDMATGEVREADVGIVGDMIASVHPRGSRSDTLERHSLPGVYLSPGLMDTHVHLESSHLPPERYAEIVLAQGTTAVFWDRSKSIFK